MHIQIIIMLISKFSTFVIGLTLAVIATATVCPTGSAAIPNCLTCSTANSIIVCSSCISGYYLASNNCVSCGSVIDRCSACSLNLASQPTCYICQSSYGLFNGACQNCTAISGCASCQITNYNLQCTSCIAGLVLYTAQMQCIPCTIANCNNCSVNNSGKFTCTACTNGYFLSNNACSACSLNISNCASCLFDQNNKLVCSACVSLSLYLTNNTCAANCSKGGYASCKTCQIVNLAANTMICTSCVSNNYLDTATNNCLPCAQALTGCLSCSMAAPLSQNTTGIVTCSVCASNFFLSANPAQCILCTTVKPNCQSCNYNFSSQSGTCTSCVSGFYLNFTDFLCYSCSSTVNFTAIFPFNSCAVCSVNGSTIFCLTCVNNYYLVNGTCKTCSDLEANCSTCTYNLTFKCLSCVSGTIINAVGQCSSCSSLFPNCFYCSASECTDCFPGYYTLNNKNCLINCAISNCNQCISKDNSKCASCKTGYSLTAQGSCSMVGCAAPLNFNGVACICPYQSYYMQTNNTCQGCSDSACQICPNNQCSKCLDGYFLWNNICKKCISNCLFCNSSDFCLLCAQRFTFVSGNCTFSSQKVLGGIGVILNANFYQLCGQGCIQCTLNACVSCRNGYLLNGTICYFCPNNCKLCKTVTLSANSQINSTNLTNTMEVVCIVCYSGMALIDSVCSACSDPNCVSCDYNTFFCLLCSITFTADQNGVCQPCASNCNFCDVGGGGTCDDQSCFLGYGRFNATSCVRCLDGCASCIGTYPYACIGCLLGSYAVTKANVSSCLNCDYGCSQCTGPNACTSCNPNFNLINGSCTILCSLPCVSCTLSPSKTQICSFCLLGYTLSNGSCVADFSCMSNKICEFCPMGYFSYRGVCYSCPSNSAQCSFAPSDPAFVIFGNNYFSFINTTQCLQGFYLDSSLTCLACPKTCVNCLSANLCTRCLYGYFLEYKLLNGISNFSYNAGICQSCASSCLQCQSQPNRCLSCKAAFFLDNFACRAYNNISFVYVLASTNNVSDANMFSSIANNLPRLYTEIGNSFGVIFVKNSHLLMIKSITNGSVVVSGYANIDNNTNDPSQIYNSLSANAQQTASISGYKVASYSVAANGFTPLTPATPTTTQSNYLIFIIIGSAIVAIAALTIIICICVRKARKKKEQGENEEVVATSEKAGQQNEPATSKNMLKSEQLYPKSSVRVQDQFSHSKKKKVDELSHISGYKKVMKGQPQERRSVRPVAIIMEQQKPSQQNSNSKSKSKSKPKTSSHLPQNNPPQLSQRYRSSQNIQIPTRDIPQNSWEEQKQQYREIEQLRNDTHLQEQKTVKASKRESGRRDYNSISKKYIPNSNSHYI